jgi:ribonuclease HI
MLSHKVHLISRINPLKYLFEKPALVGRSSKWLLLLSEFDITYIIQKSIKAQALADHLADSAIPDLEPINEEFPDEEILFTTSHLSGSSNLKPPWKVYFDGAVNKHGKGIGTVLETPHGNKYPASAKIQFECTNNMAEYEACILGLKMALEQKVTHLHVFGDSLLIISQIKGEWKTRDEKLIPYFEYLERLTEEFDEIEFTYLSRNRNSYADALATLAAWIVLTDEATIIQVDDHKEPAYCLQIELNHSNENLPWFHDIKQYLESNSFPQEANQTDKRTLQRLVMQFTLCGNHLYKRSHNHVLLRCIDEAEAREVMQEIHAGVCGPHMSGVMLAKKIMLQGYFWLTMEADCCDFVRRCHECQVHGNLIHAPSSHLHNLSSPWPFSVWGIDIIGKINPRASNGHEFILVAIDYFTKWVEAASYSTITVTHVCKFIKNNLICRYGVPNEIITDNGTNLTAKKVDDLCKQFKIMHHRSSPYRPQMNGAVEAANKILVRIIEKMVVSHRDWHEMLPYALWAYRTSIRTSTGATPYSLTYGMEAVLPVEVEIPSLRVLMEVKLKEAEWVQSRYDQLNLIEERRLKALCHAQCYQKRIARAYNKKVKPREFREGDLVLKQIRGNDGKFKPNWEGPYVVKEVYAGNAIRLRDMDGDDHPEPINAQYIKRYYA